MFEKRRHSLAIAALFAAVGVVSAPLAQAQQAMERSEYNNQMYSVLAGELALRRGETAFAVEQFMIAARISEDARLAERAARLALRISDNALALEAANRWQELDPDSDGANQMLALGLLRNGQFDESVEYFEAIREGSIEDEQEGFATVSIILRRGGQQEHAVDVIGALSQLHPESQFGHYYYAVAAFEEENYPVASAAVDQSIAVNATWAPPYLLKSRILEQQDEPDAAVEVLAKAVENMPEDAGLRDGYARMLVASGDTEKAREQFRVLVEQKADDSEALYALALLAADAEEFEESEDYFMRVLDLGARVQEVYLELGKIHERQENFEKAREWYDRITAEEPWLSGQVRIGALLSKQNKVEELRAHFENARARVEDESSHVVLIMSEGDFLAENKEYRAAFDLLAEGLLDFPENPRLLYSQALAAERVDRLDTLESNLLTLLEADPENAHALNALGYTLTDRTERHEEALAYLERAIALLPEDAAVLDSMGWVKFRMGDYEEAVTYLRDAHTQSPDAEISAHLVEVLWTKGEKEEARRVFNTALEKDPEDDKLIEVEGRLGL